MGVARKRGRGQPKKAPSDTSYLRFAQPRSKNPPFLNPGSAPGATISEREVVVHVATSELDDIKAASK